MPRTLTVYGATTQVATEDELLTFANKVRQAGGADPISALLPSKLQDSHECLIAKALNFQCQIVPQENVGGSGSLLWKDGSKVWIMSVPDHGNAFVRELAKKLKMKTMRTEYDSIRTEYELVLKLPKAIGNAADAFDWGVAFTEYAE